MTEKKQEFIGRKITSRMKPEALAASGITELIGLGNGVLAGGLTFGLYRIFSTMPPEQAHLIEGGIFFGCLAVGAYREIKVLNKLGYCHDSVANAVMAFFNNDWRMSGAATMAGISMGFLRNPSLLSIPSLGIGNIPEMLYANLTAQSIMGITLYVGALNYLWERGGAVKITEGLKKIRSWAKGAGPERGGRFYENNPGYWHDSVPVPFWGEANGIRREGLDPGNF